MKIHEYQAAEIFKTYGVPVNSGRVADAPEAAEAIAREFGRPVVVKAQVHAGGRGKAGGVKLAKTPAEARETAARILGMEIKGIAVKKVLVAGGVDIRKEAYVGVTLDRAAQKPVIMVSAAGGVDIEEVAARTPEKIVKAWVDPLLGLCDYQARDLAAALFPEPTARRAAAAVLKALYRVFVDKDCSLAEINPLVVDGAGNVTALDAKIVFDDNALYRHPEIEALRDANEEEPSETAAREANLSYVPLDGDIGCLVNGAGLAMATLDVVKLYGGHPANFLDVGGSSDPRKVVNALKIITASGKVKAILFNIFGGITRCDDIAQGILTALSQMRLDLPIVVRLTGTNEEKAREMLRGTALIPAATMVEAVKRVVEEAKRRS